MKTFLLLKILLLVIIPPAKSQLFSDNCGGGENILPVENINLCNNSEWILVFEDNFDGDSLDLAVWKNRTSQQGSLETDSEQHYSTLDNAIVENGKLKIIAKKERVHALTVHWKDSNEILSDGLPNLRWHNFTTAYVFTHELFGYGLFEASCKIPSGKGFWPAMWMYGEHFDQDNIRIREEIDVFEFWKDDPENHNMDVHYAGYHCLKDYNGPDFSKDFHTFSVIWDPYKIDWFVDGDLVRHYPKYTQNGADAGCRLNAWQPYQEAPFPRNPMNLRFNLAIDNRDGHEPDNSTPFPSMFEIDWVRYYQKEGSNFEQTKTQFYSFVYPNPIRQTLTVETDEFIEGEIEIRIFSSQSVLLFKESSNSRISHINVEHLPAGLYFMQIERPDTQQSNVHKIVISN